MAEDVKKIIVPFTVHAEILDEQLLAAKAHQKRRSMYMICGGEKQPVQAFLNTFCIDSYAQPHRHGFAERFECVDGVFIIFEFGDMGAIRSAHYLYEGDVYTVKPHTFHTAVCVSEHGTVYEYKECYYSANDKEFAPWAATELTPDAETYFQTLRQHA